MSNANWWACVKYMDGKTENVPVSKMRIRNTVSERERTKTEYRHFDPETLTDFQLKKQYYAYSKQGVVADANGDVKESLWVCYIGRLAGRFSLCFLNLQSKLPNSTVLSFFLCI